MSFHEDQLVLSTQKTNFRALKKNVKKNNFIWWAYGVVARSPGS